MVRLPVFLAAGSVADSDEKYAPYPQPRSQTLRSSQVSPTNEDSAKLTFGDGEEH